ncbi:MAG: HD domain-containing protein [Treponema sp.]|nr:HD domain-containing protein [Treponema sp.]
MKGLRNSLEKICTSLYKTGFSAKLIGFSAIDRYLGLPDLPYIGIETNADIAVLARLMENLRFPGIDLAAGAVDTNEGSCYFRCIETGENSGYTFPLLSFSYDYPSRRFHDPKGVYPLLKELKQTEKLSLAEPAELPKTSRYKILMETGLLLARYDSSVSISKLSQKFTEALEEYPSEAPPGPESQRVFLCSILLSRYPERGLEFFKRTGLLKELWPELADLDDVDHSKEYHPEGNAWSHTLETFRHRKAHSSGAYDLKLSLGLLVHDMGKPISASFGSRRFDGHAELGARAAARFLKRLEFENCMVDDIYYLVRHHMLPAALKRLPLTKTAEIMSSPVFPTLMELYRCDESSSFKGLDEYYENSAAYKAYLKNLKNPYRSPDGKKINRAAILNPK